ncbi:hypothetical protein phiIBBPAA2_0005A [Pseudomonas phage phiIBB-PAA2]|uniref:Uncharacterized protein n=1 Tax=Pseudomonas phage phiIBB-PAA2 TaxID=1429758 RepID=V5R605_9CAUD|nr:hypothetical protein phiIBBPAA2_0005A [Pseudomonas phage phiIBB-PAA2]AHB30105.1 hypothetical protein phiIBBPAA2_0005A [Pseudomonas phage phiIBB-PAA2]
MAWKYIACAAIRSRSNGLLLVAWLVLFVLSSTLDSIPFAS